ncbi:hypothetical protein BSL78_06332 [Apostichopus japonicus]|uniref:GIY-YIG domain-containing protein n=1 Tax=Stichopus japonicus TaxID=307972 RepID=A0A2G8L922_STIJA|nr:hypothetical protein BSL78_06332 [Apostichopus japonicus]
MQLPRSRQLPLRGNCLVNDVIYKATVTSGTDNASYIGLASGEFKKRYNNHTKSFQHDRYKKETELSKHIWQLKEKKAEYSIHWEIVSQSRRTSGSLVYAIFAKKSSKLPPSKATRSTREASSSLPVDMATDTKGNHPAVSNPNGSSWNSNPYLLRIRGLTIAELRAAMDSNS